MGTRRFNALKLWMAFKFMGQSGYAETVERHLELTRYLAERLDDQIVSIAVDYEPTETIGLAVDQPRRAGPMGVRVTASGGATRG